MKQQTAFNLTLSKVEQVVKEQQLTSQEVEMIANFLARLDELDGKPWRNWIYTHRGIKTSNSKHLK